MDQVDQEKKINNTDEVSVADFFAKIRSLFRYLKNKWKLILLMGFLGAGIGVLYSIIKKPLYTATCTFVLEEGNQAGSLGQYAGLASLAGIDIGGGGNGIFSPDNILELYKSRLMIEKTLLSQGDFNGKQQLLIDRYINVNKLRVAGKKKGQIDSITFYGAPEKFSRKQDSIITDIVYTIDKKILDVSKPDKKLSIIEVDVKSTDEEFSKQFNDKLVENVNDFYTKTKIKKSYQNVQTLQKQADSVRQVLDLALNGVASTMDASPNANPALMSLRVPSQKKQIDVQANTAIYSEIVKNLEISKISLRQEKPLIQVIDPPVLPLAVDRLGKLKGLIIGFVLGMLVASIIVVTKKVYQSIIL